MSSDILDELINKRKLIREAEMAGRQTADTKMVVEEAKKQIPMLNTHCDEIRSMITSVQGALKDTERALANLDACAQCVALDASTSVENLQGLVKVQSQEGKFCNTTLPRVNPSDVPKFTVTQKRNPREYWKSIETLFNTGQLLYTRHVDMLCCAMMSTEDMSILGELEGQVAEIEPNRNDSKLWDAFRKLFLEEYNTSVEAQQQVVNYNNASHSAKESVQEYSQRFKKLV